MLKLIDYYLDRITMYRLVLYSLILLLFIASLFGIFNGVPYSPITIILSSVFLVAVGWITNKIFAWAFDAPTNVESVYITTLILALIISPVQSFSELPFLTWAAILAILSKFVLAINKKHIFNPAAIAMVITSFALGDSASWWIGTTWMAPFVAIAGFLIIRKLRFTDLAWSFFTTAVAVSMLLSLLKGNNPLTTLQQVVLHSSMLFMGSIMLTEPMTMPPTKKLQMIFGGLVGLLAVPQFNIFGFFFTPEIALCAGNIFAYIVSPKGKFLLFLDEKIAVSTDVIDFVFKPQRRLAYQPGQYMEWTLQHPRTDSRGNRRYFTLASSPTEENIRLGVRISPNGSSYKKALKEIDENNLVVGAQLAGDFTLPKNKNQKLVFMAGGIGITPFRSMIKYLIDKNEKRDIVLIYSNKTAGEIAYKEVFDEAQEKIGAKILYTLTNFEAVPAGWNGERGRVDAEMIRREVPDFAERLFYLSGPQVMVQSYENSIRQLGVKGAMLKKDFFPGLV
ncbi:MAG: FAD-binding oxidoreductase [Candidatus Levyibacteriota bacterium]